MSQRVLRDYLLPALMLAGLVLGGSSSGGYWANMVLQLLALAALAALLIQARALALSRPLLLIAGAIILLPVLQLLPLPPALWTALPGRAEIAQGFDLAGMPKPWLPLSLDGDATLTALTALFPPLAVLLVAAQASPRGRQLALLSVLGVALVSVGLGLLQRLSGNGAALQPYELTNPGMATGLFANRNHFATLLLAAIPCAALAIPLRAALLPVCAGLAGGVLLTGSDAGALLVLPMLAVSLLYVRPLWPLGRGVLMTGVVLATVVAGLLGLWQLQRSLAEPPAGGAEQHRPAMIATTLTAARDYLPLGSGAGSFQRIYPRYEDPARADPEYRNHAHSDYAEVALEYGLPGLVIAIAVLAWWGSGLLHAGGGAARAGGAALGVILLHSAVDYPLRTAAMAMLAALATVLLDRAAEPDQPDSTPARDQGRDALRISL
ncbi:O-antigen ligase family protein [Novosphingobium sp. B 225]|uniref:O-antigen ligase family protein n=1 Tax=Novosphingobium sp. B 225 TaxID=1961849 RepID=UPI000B4B9788|nr:O-antigen ligase family protein [Novosphingobium sp. B 225]